MTSPYHNRLPMAYLPASRAVESVGIPPMFRSRVRGMCASIDDIVGTSQPRENWGELAKEAARREAIIADYEQKLAVWKAGLAAAQAKCPPVDPNIMYTNPIVCTPALEYMRSNPMPVEPPRIGPIPSDYTPFPTKVSTPTPAPTPAAGAKATGSAIPLILGAAYLLLS